MIRWHLHESKFNTPKTILPIQLDPCQECWSIGGCHYFGLPVSITPAVLTSSSMVVQLLYQPGSYLAVTDQPYGPINPSFPILKRYDKYLQNRKELKIKRGRGRGRRSLLLCFDNRDQPEKLIYYYIVTLVLLPLDVAHT